VIAAGKRLRRARRPTRQFGPAMAAGIVETPDFPVAAADNEHRMVAQPRRNIVTVVRHLAFMAQIEPAAAENFCHFAIENPGIGKRRAVYAEDALLRPVVDQRARRNHLSPHENGKPAAMVRP